MNILIYLDLSDLYHRVNRKFGQKINYEIVMDYFKNYGNVICAHAYGIQRKNEAIGFITCLKHLGYTTHFKYPEIIKCGDRELKRANWDAQIVVDILKNNVDGEVILGSGSNNMVPLVRFLVDHNTRCTLFSCGIGKELKYYATNVLEITEELLET